MESFNQNNLSLLKSINCHDEKFMNTIKQEISKQIPSQVNQQLQKNNQQFITKEQLRKVIQTEKFYYLERYKQHHLGEIYKYSIGNGCITGIGSHHIVSHQPAALDRALQAIPK